jgi:hypothetical protein
MNKTRMKRVKAMKMTKMKKVKVMKMTKMKRFRAKKKTIRTQQPRLTRELRALGISQESDEKSEEQRPTRSKMTRELSSLGTLPPAEESTTTTTSSNNEGSPGSIHSAITSDPGVPTTFEEAVFGPMSHVWRPAIYEELMSFINKKAFKNKIRN